MTPSWPPSGYELVQRLGAGGMGEVWKARQRSSGDRFVALKRVRVPDDRHLAARSRREGELLSALDHPHIVRIHELLPDGSGVIIVMQYAAGGSLADRLAGEQPLQPAQAGHAGAAIGEALASAHRAGVLHRDVKPANILFTSDGEPLLSDFGIALAEGAQRLTTAAGGHLGTAEYLDPAVAAGGEPTERSDVYSLAVVCYQMLTGRAPFEGSSPLAVLRAAEEGRYQPLRESAPHVARALADAVERGLHRHPEQRFGDAASFAAALRTATVPACSGPQTAAPPLVRRSAVAEPLTRRFGPAPPQRPPPPPRARAVRWPAVAAVALVLATLPPLAAWGIGARHTPRSAGSAASDRPVVTPAPTPPAAVSCPRPGDTGTDGFLGDTDADGCDEIVRWDGRTLVRTLDGGDQVRYRLGRRGDQLLLGDWNCDGRDTPALYRPSTGQIFAFDGWAGPRGDLVSAPARDSGVRGGRAAVQPDPRGCDRVTVPAAGPYARRSPRAAT